MVTPTCDHQRAHILNYDGKCLCNFQVNPTLTQEALVTHCQELGVAVMAFSPFGFVVSRNRPDAPPPRSDDPVLVQMAQKYNKSVGQIVLRYLVSYQVN